MTGIADIPFLNAEEEDPELVIDETSVFETLPNEGEVIPGEHRLKTDEEFMEEAFAKYGRDPRVLEVKPTKIRRPDGSTYVRPLIIGKPDLTIGNLVFPGGSSGSRGFAD